METYQVETATITKCFVKRSDLVTRHITGETIIVPVRAQVAESDSIYTLNDLGSLIWGLIDGQNRVGELIQAVCAEYDVQPNEAAQDLVEFLGSLEAEGLIRSSDDGER